MPHQGPGMPPRTQVGGLGLQGPPPLIKPSARVPLQPQVSNTEYRRVSYRAFYCLIRLSPDCANFWSVIILRKHLVSFLRSTFRPKFWTGPSLPFPLPIVPRVLHILYLRPPPRAPPKQSLCGGERNRTPLNPTNIINWPRSPAKKRVGVVVVAADSPSDWPTLPETERVAPASHSPADDGAEISGGWCRDTGTSGLASQWLRNPALAADALRPLVAWTPNCATFFPRFLSVVSLCCTMEFLALNYNAIQASMIHRFHGQFGSLVPALEWWVASAWAECMAPQSLPVRFPFRGLAPPSEPEPGNGPYGIKYWSIPANSLTEKKKIILRAIWTPHRTELLRTNSTWPFETAASPEILHHTIRRTWWNMIVLLIPTPPPVHFSLKCWENILFELWSERAKRYTENPCVFQFWNGVSFAKCSLFLMCSPLGLKLTRC